MKPASSAHLRWGTIPLIPADLTEPDGTHKDEGWQDTERPPHSFFNYWMNLVYLWVVYLDNITDEALTWTGAHVFQAAVDFQAGITVTGGFGVLASSVTTTGNIGVGGALTAGATTLSSTLAVTGNTTVGGTLGVTGNTTIGGTLETTSSIHSDLNLTVDGSIFASLLQAVGGTLAMIGNMTVSGFLSVTGALTATGLFTANGGIAIPAVTGATLNPAGGAWASVAGDTVGFWKDAFGVVHLQGLAGVGVTANVIFQLPAGSRPTHARQFVARKTSTADCVVITIDTSGNVNSDFDGGISGGITLDGITFRTT